MRAFIIESALRWFRDFGADALRLDAVHALMDHRAVHILEELAVRVAELSDELGRPLSLIAESDLNDPRLIAPRAGGGFGLDAQWTTTHHAIHTAVSGERQGYYADFGSFECLAKYCAVGSFTMEPIPRSAVAITAGQFRSIRFRHRGWWCSPATTTRSATRHRRPAHRLPQRRATRHQGGAGAALPFTPMLFQGEEWAARTPFQYFTSHPEPELGDAVRNGRRAEFAEHGWHTDDVPDPQDPETFGAPPSTGASHRAPRTPPCSTSTDP